ncbi:hypothetical protein BX600DRAFT_490161 [Xylariales sp. PMI_506]|nr:hypothetical protein BX600DRAFT_490161 [Xylariales sp. PMI_506]
MPSIRKIGALLLPLVRLVQGDTCSEVAATTSVDVADPISLEYISEQDDYWSTSCSALLPSCILFPTTADEVAAIVKILATNNETFAVKSGGHSPNNYFSSVAGGPLISMSNFNEVVLDEDTGIVQVGPGLRLDEVAAKLDGTGWTFVGGRIGNTGLGGLMLGGGISYMSAEYGWAASSVVEYEIVLANGTITTVSAAENADLFQVLKGGGNMLGIVTTYTVQTYQQGDIYGGNLWFERSDEVDAQMLQAVRDFTEYNTDPKAAVIVTAERAYLDLLDTWLLFVFYDGTDPQDAFKNFTDIGPTLSTATVQSYAELIENSNWVIVKGSVVDIGTETIPLPSSEHEDVLEAIHAHWRNVSGSVQSELGIVASIAYQPFPKSVAAAAAARSPDLVGLTDDIDRIVVELDYSFVPQADYNAMADVMEDTYSGIRDIVLEGQAAGNLSQGYLPLYLNYGFYRQDYFGRLMPESAQLAAAVAAEVDPTGLFRDRTGGFRP